MDGWINRQTDRQTCTEIGHSEACQEANVIMERGALYRKHVAHIGLAIVLDPDLLFLYYPQPV